MHAVQILSRDVSVLPGSISRMLYSELQPTYGTPLMFDPSRLLVSSYLATRRNIAHLCSASVSWSHFLPFLVFKSQLAGRPVPDICRHLGLTSATTLNSSGGVASLRSTNTQGQNKRKNSTSGNCGSGKSSIVDHPRPRGNMGSHGDGEPQPSAATSGGSVAQGSRPGSDSSALNVPTAAASTARDRGSDTTRVPGVLFDPGVPLGTDEECRPGSAVRATVKKRGRTAPLVLLPRHRIFYSSTFVR